MGAGAASNKLQEDQKVTITVKPCATTPAEEAEVLSDASPDASPAPSSQVSEASRVSGYSESSSSQPSRSGGLAARRGFKERCQTIAKPLKVATGRGNFLSYVLGGLRRLQDEKCSSGLLAEEKRCINAIGEHSFAKMYQLGEEVMPSGHEEAQIRYATRLNDGGSVVVKVRRKDPKEATQDAAWRMNTEFMLNLPKSGHIAHLYEVLEDKVNYYVVMEKVEGLDLFETLGSGRLPVSTSKEIIRQLLQALVKLHENGLIHKDLKLENIMVTSTSRSTRKLSRANSLGSLSTASSSVCPATPTTTKVKLIDFDTVEEFTPGRRPSVVVGTDQYIAQEAYAGNYSPASDIFAVGVIAFKLITGKFPFKHSMFDDRVGENWVGSPKMKEIQEKVKKAQIDWSRFGSDKGAEALCRSMLAVREADRPKASQALRNFWLSDASPRPSIARATLCPTCPT